MFRKLHFDMFGRCDIPVIIMGETGCGKTRLVKFMCALQSPPGVEVNNMILMKVDLVFHRQKKFRGGYIEVTFSAVGCWLLAVSWSAYIHRNLCSELLSQFECDWNLIS